MTTQEIFRRYQQLQTYVGWTDIEASRVNSLAPHVAPAFPALIEDFYAVIQQHAAASKVITGGPAQITRLKGTLLNWLHELFRGPYDEGYAARRWRVGLRHVEIGLDQVYTNAALSRLRTSLVRELQQRWTGDADELRACLRALHLLLDLDLALIEDAYQSEYAARQNRAERLAAIGKVAGGIAHELRNPLNVIKTSIYYLLHARNPTPEKKTEHLLRIERQVSLADDVITALSNFARMPGPNLKTISLEQCFREALESSPVPDRCRLSIQIPADLPPVLGDLDQLRIVLSNLIRNAWEAMPNGGALTITGIADRDRVQAVFADTGTGIDPEFLSRIMEPLYSTKARGLGLGLALAKAILEKNHGSLAVTSEQGRGTTFIVSLLAAQASGVQS